MPVDMRIMLYYGGDFCLGGQTVRTEAAVFAPTRTVRETFLPLLPSRVTELPSLAYATVGIKLVDGRAATGDTARPDAPRLWPHCECGRALTIDLPSSAASASTS